MTAAYVFNKFITDCFNAEIALNSSTFKLLLINDYEFDPTQENLNDLIESEISSTSIYPLGGVTLTGVTWGYDNGSNSWIFSADNLLFTVPDNETLGPMTGAVVYKYDGSNNPLCVFIDFENEEEFDEASVFQVILDANGVFKLTKGT